MHFKSTEISRTVDIPFKHWMLWLQLNTSFQLETGNGRREIRGARDNKNCEETPHIVHYCACHVLLLRSSGRHMNFLNYFFACGESH